MGRTSHQFVGAIPSGRYTILGNDDLRVAYEMYFDADFKAREQFVGIQVAKRTNRRSAQFLDAKGHTLVRTGGKRLHDGRQVVSR